MTKRLTLLILVICMIASCKIADPSHGPLVITISASAYIGSSTTKAYANFALLKSTQIDVVKDENTLVEYFKAHPGYTTYLLDYQEAGTYIIAVQLPANSAHEKLYSYRTITVSDGHPSTDN
ncbi:MAG: hypothetical protein H7289_08560, partial [Mucilaginibacter sp.]|nr:hypothetical protein [Mucilaginibacter sp.]